MSRREVNRLFVEYLSSFERNYTALKQYLDQNPELGHWSNGEFVFSPRMIIFWRRSQLVTAQHEVVDIIVSMAMECPVGGRQVRRSCKGCRSYVVLRAEEKHIG